MIIVAFFPDVSLFVHHVLLIQSLSTHSSSTHLIHETTLGCVVQEGTWCTGRQRSMPLVAVVNPFQ